MIRLVMAVLSLAVGGCGLQGDLYLPSAPEPVPAGEPPALPPAQPEPDAPVEAAEDVDSAADEDPEP